MDIKIRGSGCIDLIKELAKLNRTMTLMALSPNVSGLNIESRKERGIPCRE